MTSGVDLSGEAVLEMASSPMQIRNAVEGEVRFHDGEDGAYTDLEVDLNLNALAIGFGLENIEYEPESFRGLVYRVDKPAATALLFEDGQITVVDGQTKSNAGQAIETTIERIQDLNLAGGFPDQWTVQYEKTEVDESVPSFTDTNND